MLQGGNLRLTGFKCSSQKLREVEKYVAALGFKPQSV